MQAGRRRFLTVLAALLLAVILPVTALGLELPCFLILGVGVPQDVSMSLVFPESTGVEPAALERGDRAWESYFRFHFQGVPITWRDGMPEGTELQVKAGEESFSLSVPEKTVHDFHTVYALDWDSRSLSEGVPENRAGLLGALRWGLSAFTLLLQALLFFLLGYRTRHSWLIFSTATLGVCLLINLGLVPGGSTLFDSYTGWAVTAILLAEFFLLILEPMAFSYFLFEKGERRAVLSAFLLNGAALAIALPAVCLLPM